MTAIRTVDYHTGGEPFRIVTGGVPPLEGTTLLERRRFARDHLDRFPVVVAARLARIWDVWRPAPSVEFNDFFERRGHLSSTAGLLMYYVLLPLSVYGLVVLRRARVTIIPFVGIKLLDMLLVALRLA